MKYFYSLVLFFSLFVSKETFAQNSPEISVPKIYDDANGKIITNPQSLPILDSSKVLLPKGKVQWLKRKKKSLKLAQHKPQ